MTHPPRVVSSPILWLITIVLSLTGALAHAATCDVDADGDIDRKDYLAILADIGERASRPNDPRDADRNGRILSNDAQLCARRCTLALCAIPANKAPIGKNDAATTALDTRVRINVIANDRDRDGRIVPRTVRIVTKPQHGKVTRHRDGTVTYSPALGFQGRDRFRYRVKDNDGAKSNVAKVTVTVRPGNVPPPANVPPVANNDSAATAVNTPVLINVVANDTDANGNLDPATVAIVSNPANGGVVNNLNGTVTYTPSPGFFGTDSFTYNVKDTRGATSNVATVTVGVNAVPTADAGPDANAVTGQPATLDGSGSSDPNADMITFSWRFLSTAPGSNLADTDIVNRTSPAPSFTPDVDGDYELELTVTDPGGLSDTDTVVISAATPNVAPNADAGLDQNAEVLTLVNLDGSGSSDPDNGPVTPLTFQWSFVSVPLGSGIDETDLQPDANSTQPSFTPDVIGLYRVTLTVSDGDLSDSDDVDINVTQPNVPPNANAGSDIVVQLGPPAETATLDGSASDDPDDFPNPTLTFQWSFVSVPSVPVPSALTDDDITDATTPTPSFTPDQPGMYTLQLVVSDGSASDSDEVMVTANAAPLAVDDAFDVDEDTPLTVPAPGVLANDTDANSDPLTAVLVSGQPANAQSFTFNADGSFNYTPNANFTGTDSFTYEANDGSADSNVATVTITVNPVNDAPVAVDDPSYTTNEDGGALAGTSVLANDTDEEGDSLTAILDAGPTNAQSFTLNPDGTFSYTPNIDFFGTDTFTYHANDGTSDSNVATVTINVEPVNDAPAFNSGGNVSVLEDAGSVTVAWATGISAGPANEAGQTLNFLVSNDNNGLFFAQPAVSPSGVLTFTTAPNAFGSATVTVTLQDNGGTANSGVDTSGPQVFTITVMAVNDAPVATAKSHQTHSGIRVTIGAADTGKLKEGATDVDDPFSDLAVNASFSSITPAGATIVLSDAATGTFTYNPPAGFSGAASFQFQVCDDGAPTPPVTCSTPTTVSFNVTGPDLWFVQQGASGTGQLTDPLGSLGSLPAGRGTGDRIFAFTGTYGGHTLNGSEHLIGQGSSGSFDSVLGVAVPGNGTLDARPALGGTRPQLGGTVTLAANNTVRGLNIVTSGATGLTGSNFGTLTASEVSVTGDNGAAISLVTGDLAASFTRISSTGGSVPGINLSNTTGTFTVTGNGGSCTSAATCTGGSIANKTGASEASGTPGIRLTNVTNVRLNFMNISGNNHSGILGTTVNGFRLGNGLIENNGNTNPPDETGVDISNLIGTASGGTNPTSITGTTIRNNFEFQLQITNTTGTLTDLQMSGNSISSTGASGVIGNLVNFLALGTANMTLNLTSGTFTGAAPATATGLQCDHSGTGGTATCNISGATFTNNNVAVSVSQAQGGNLRFNVSNNTATQNRSHGLNLFVAAIGTGTVDGSFVNNIVGTQGVMGSGANLGFGIRVQNEGVNTTNPANVLISGNTVQEMTNFSGINVNQGIFAQPTSRSTNVTITNNTIRDVDNSRAIIVQQNNSTNITGSAGVACADISGNEMNNIAGNIGDGTKIRLRQLAGGTFNLRQTSLADLAAANSPPNGVATTTTTTAQISAGGTISFNAGTCTQP